MISVKSFSRFSTFVARDGLQEIGYEIGFTYNFAPMSGFLQILRINNSQNQHQLRHQSSACAQQFQRTKNLTADS